MCIRYWICDFPVLIINSLNLLFYYSWEVWRLQLFYKQEAGYWEEPFYLSVMGGGFCLVLLQQRSEKLQKSKKWKCFTRDKMIAIQSSVHLSCSAVSDSLQPHGLQHTRPPCPSPTPRACFLSCFKIVLLFATLWFELAQTRVHQVGDTIQPCHHLSSPTASAFNLSQHQGLFRGGVLHIRWPKYWSFSFSISPSNEYSRLVSFRID